MKFGHGFSDELFRQRLKTPTSGKAAGVDGLYPVFQDSFGEDGSQTLRENLVWRTLPLVLFFTAVYFLFFIRLFDLAVVNGGKYFSLSEGNRRRIEYISAQRGVFTDRTGKVIVRNFPAFKVMLISLKLTPEHYSALEKRLGISQAEIKAKALQAQNSGVSELVLKRGLSRDESLSLEAVQDSVSPLLRFTADAVRDYLNPEVFAHTLGYLGEAAEADLKKNPSFNYLPGEAVGKDGLENIYEKFLRGVAGERVLETDAEGKAVREISQKEPVAGDNLVTTLDSALGSFAFEALKKAVEDSGATGGVVVAQSPENGQILLLESYPSFDPGAFSKGLSAEQYQKLSNDPSRPLFNRAVLGTYPPGSVFKLVTALSALQEGTITENTTVDDRGSIAVGSFVFNDWKPEGHGVIKLVAAIAQSCDVYFYTIGGGYGEIKGVGPEKISAWAKKLRLGALLGIDLPAEAEGLVGDPEWKKTVRGEDWYIGNTYHMAIGQGDILTTPLQINSLTATLANGGTLYSPHLVSQIRTESGTLVKQFLPEVIDKIGSNPKYLALIKEGMAGVVGPGGTAYPMQGFPLKTGGKTGTSEFGVSVGGVYKTHAWFTVFAPFDKPEIALTILLEGGGQGSDDAAPVARKILDEWLKKRSVK